MKNKFLLLWLLIMTGNWCFANENLSAKVKKDIRKYQVWVGKPLACYVVPPISSIKRLPDTIPTDGTLSDQLQVVAAKGEFEPASFVVFPFRDFSKVKITATNLLSGDKVMPADAIDIRVVKCWYQGGTAWHSYFADKDRRSLIPELLLHDENLIKVDLKTKENYLRLNYPSGSEYIWISYPSQAKGKLNIFNHRKEPVADSPTLKPVKLTSGTFKQFWITIKIPETAREGIYSGHIIISADGKKLATLNLKLRVLPFCLPSPKTYYDLKKDFYTSIYNHTHINVQLEMLGENEKAAEKLTLAEMRNLRDHNVLSPLVGALSKTSRRQLELMKEAGLQTKPIFGLVKPYNWELLYRYLRNGYKVPEEKWKTQVKRVDSGIALAKDVLGHSDIYGIGWDEPGRSTLEAEQKLFALLHDKGVRIMDTGKDSHLKYAGFNEDFVNYPGHPFKPESARIWHAMGAKITSYAGPHTGPENPDFIRHSHGMNLYKADYDGTANYRYYGYRTNIWNDFESDSYRICFVYPTQTGVIDTLHWEGFREGIDDIRYATKLRQIACKAIKAGGAKKRYAGKKALQYLALLDEKKVDLDTMRLEMINYILKIQKLLKGDK